MKHKFAVQLTTTAAVSICMIAGAWAAVASKQLRAAVPQPPVTIRAETVGGGNTYHLTGTAYLDGKPQPWEVWGRHTPFFLYERRGNDVTQDDGASVRSIYGPAGHRRQSVGVVGAQSEAGRYQGGYADVAVSSLLLDHDWPLLTNAGSWTSALQKKALTPTSSTATSLVYTTPVSTYTSLTGAPTNAIFTVSNDGALQSYALDIERQSGPVELEKLTAQYDVVIPADILAPINGSADVTYDVAPGDVTSLRSAKVILKVVAVDRDGNILIDGHAPGQTGIWSILSAGRHLLVACQAQGRSIEIFPYIEAFAKRNGDGESILLLCPETPLDNGSHPVLVAPRSRTAFNINYMVDLDAPIDVVPAHQTITANATIDTVPVAGDLDASDPLSTMKANGLKDDQIKKYVDAARSRLKP